MLPAILARKLSQVRRLPAYVQPRAAVEAANDNAPGHALWRKFVAAGIGALFALALVLVGLVCTGHAAEPRLHSSHPSGQD